MATLSCLHDWQNYFASVQAGETVHHPFRIQKSVENMRAKRTNCLPLKESGPSPRCIASWRKLLWEKCGLSRNEAGLKAALRRIPELREEFWKTSTSR